MKDRDQEIIFSRYDAADYLKTDEDMLHYLEAVMEEGDPALIAAALGDIARVRNLSQLSGKSDCSPPLAAGAVT